MKKFFKNYRHEIFLLLATIVANGLAAWFISKNSDSTSFWLATMLIQMGGQLFLGIVVAPLKNGRNEISYGICWMISVAIAAISSFVWEEVMVGSNLARVCIAIGFLLVMVLGAWLHKLLYKFFDEEQSIKDIKKMN